MSDLDINAEDVKLNSVIPAGAYRMKIAGSYSTFITDENPEKNPTSWTIINVPCEILKPQDNVDSKELEDFGYVRGLMLYLQFFFPTRKEQASKRHDNASVQLKRFLAKLEGDVKGNLLDCLDSKVQKEFIGDVLVKPKYNDPTEYENKIGKTYSVKTYPNVK